MAGEGRSERTARLLALRLEELSRSLERTHAPRRDAARLIELASVATAHAVSLELLTSERARSIWEDAAARHPVLRVAAPRSTRPHAHSS